MDDQPPQEEIARLLDHRNPTDHVEFRQRGGRSYLVFRNEFAVVWLSLNAGSSGVELQVTDAETGDTIGLDALELEAISRMTHRDFDELILERGARRPTDR